jgi:hypothetical protein
MLLFPSEAEINTWNGFFPEPSFETSNSSSLTSISNSTGDDQQPVKKEKKKKPSKVCQHPGGCNKYSQGGTRFCIGHGGGKKCSVLNCNKSVQGTRSLTCISHGGGKRCDFDGCMHAARGSSNRCCAHGGGPRCKETGCRRSAQRPSDYCVTHGGGKRCATPGCNAILRGSSNRLCARHTEVEPLMNRMGILTNSVTNVHHQLPLDLLNPEIFDLGSLKLYN